MQEEVTSPVWEPELQFWRKETVLEKVPFSNATLYRLIKVGDFPAQIRLSKNISAWKSTDVIAWMNAKSGGVL